LSRLKLRAEAIRFMATVFFFSKGLSTPLILLVAFLLMTKSA